MHWQLPASWSRVLREETEKPYFAQLRKYVDQQRRHFTVYPPAKDVFHAIALTPYPKVRVVVLGQDPYHDEGQAHGLCFSVPPSVAPPPSLVNIFRELHNDMGCPIPAHGCLDTWARRGVLLVNTVLTVRAHEPHSHKGQGWETFTDAVICSLNRKRTPVVFVLWGRPAQKKIGLIDSTRHAIVQGVHPSPLSAHRGFLGSRPFSVINRALTDRGLPPIVWQLPSEPTTNRRPTGYSPREHRSDSP